MASLGVGAHHRHRVLIDLIDCVEDETRDARGGEVSSVLCGVVVVGDHDVKRVEHGFAE